MNCFSERRNRISSTRFRHQAGLHTALGACLTVLLIAGSSAYGHPRHVDPTTCVCDTARIENGWCGKCDKGFIAGMLIPSGMLYDEIDPHGHDIQKERIECKSCQTAIARDGYCDTCHVGFVNELAYMSKLTYCLARGTIIRTDENSCKACRLGAGRPSWCGACKRGFLGHFSYSDKGMFERAVHAYGIIEATVRELARCEVCAAAIVVNGHCTKCRKRFVDGRAMPKKGASSASPPPASSKDDSPSGKAESSRD